MEAKILVLPKKWKYDAAIKKPKSPSLWRAVLEKDSDRLYFWNMKTDETKWEITKKQLPPPYMHSPKSICRNVERNELFKECKRKQTLEHVIETVK